MKWGKTLDHQWVPFDKNGDQKTYGDYGDPYSEPTAEEQKGIDRGWGIVERWVPNTVFADTLQYVTYHRGRSSAMFEFKRASNRKSVYMFMTDIDDIVPKMVSGTLSGVFTFSKRGANYGVKMVTDIKPV